MEDSPSNMAQLLTPESINITPVLQALAENVSDGLLVFDHDGRLICWNQVAQQSLARTGELSTGRRLRCLDESLQSAQGAPIPTADNPLNRALRGEAVNGVRVFLPDPNQEQGLQVVFSAQPIWSAESTRPISALLRFESKQQNPEQTVEAVQPVPPVAGESDRVVGQIAGPTGNAQAGSNLNQPLVAETFANLPAIAFAVDSEGKFLHFTKHLIERTDYSPDDLARMTVFDLFTGRAREQFTEMFAQLVQSGAPQDADIPIMARAGDTIPLSLRAAATPHNQLPLFSLVGFDLSRISDMLQASAISEERLSRSQAFANIGLWDWNLQTDEIYWSDRIGELVGYMTSHIQFGFHELLSFAHPADRSRLAASIENCVSGHDVVDEEFRIQRPDGSQHWMLARANLIHDNEGRPIRMLGIIQDITPLKHAEFVEKQARSQIQSIIDSLEARICVVEENGEIISANRAWQRNPYHCDEGQTGSHLSLSGNYLAFCDHLASAGHADMATLADNVRSVLSGDVSSSETEVRVRYHDSNQIHLIRITPLSGSTDQHPCAVITHQDVTEMREIERDLRNAKERAEAASRAKSEFLSLMSHELRTPMNAVLGFAQLLDQDHGLTQDQLDNVKEILNAGKHLLQLINEVLDLARIESGRLDLVVEPVALSDLAAECYPLVEFSARQNNITVNMGSLRNMAVLADRVRIKQILINLLTNAVKYNRPGGKVFLEAIRTETGRIRIEVKDTGFGIPKDAVEGLFDPFSRLERDIHQEGTGIGLAVCRRLIEAMGGRIGAVSELEQGSCFWVELSPALSEAAEECPVSKCDAPSAFVQSNRNSYCVLQIEDNPSNLKVMEQMLDRLPGIRTISAQSGAEGYDLAKDIQPDLILLDIHMPNMNGYEVLQLLRGNSSTINIPVIAVTANAAPADVAKGLGAGFDAYMTKPIEFQKLSETIQQFIIR